MHAYHKVARPQCPARCTSTAEGQISAGEAGHLTHASWRFFGFIVPEFRLQDLGGHGVDILHGVIPGDGCKHEQSFANGRYELSIDSHRGRFHSLNNGCVSLLDGVIRYTGVQRDALLMLVGGVADVVAGEEGATDSGRTRVLSQQNCSPLSLANYEIS